MRISKPHAERFFRSSRDGLAAIWGFLESTCFFIVPDVWLTRIAVLEGLGSSLRACVWSAMGALLGGTVIYAIARHQSADHLLALFLHLPGITHQMEVNAISAFASQKTAALLNGAVSGVPYKLFAAAAGAEAYPFLTFLLASAGARLARFAATCCIAFAVSSLCLQSWPLKWRLRLHLAAWVAFYVIYFLGHRG